MDSSNKHCTFIFEKDRYKCGVGNCSHHSRIASELECHLSEHGSIKRFTCPHCNEKLESTKDRNYNLSHADIMRHLELHGNDLFSCFNCDRVFSSEFQVQLHITRRHSTLEFKYQHKNFDSKGQATLSDEVSVMFDCNICHQPIPTTAMAMEHFKNSHQGANVDCTAIALINRMTRHMEVLPAHPSFLLQQHLICAVCDIKLPTKERLIAHHRKMHYPRPIAIRISSLMCFNNVTLGNLLEMSKANSTFDRHIFYACAHCQETDTYFSTVDGVLMHWSETHENDDHLPFRFCANQLVSCKYCQTLSTFRDLIKHHAQNHQTQTFVAVSPKTANQCSICNYQGENIIDHFRCEHSMLSQENILEPVCLTDDTINQLLDINVRKKFKCGRCDAIHETEDDIKDHYLEEHKTLEYERIEFNDNKSVQLIGGCCRSDLDQITFFDHLATHERNFCCPKCSFHTDDSFEFMDHGIEAHEIHNDACSLDLKFMRSSYWNSKYIFGNGLVLNKYNLIGTSIDDSPRFKEFSEAYVAERERSHYKKM